MINIKLGHQAPKNRRVNTFNSIELEGDFAHCISHNFIYNSKEEEDKLYDGKACYYTDTRFEDSPYNFFENCYIHWTRFKEKSLKTCIRKTLKCKNIPIGTIVEFKKSWYESGVKFGNSFNFKVRKENKLNIEFEINDPEYSANFTDCKFSQELTNELRKNGFIVKVENNDSFLMNMINTAISLTGEDDFVDNKITGEIAIAYGHGKKIGFSSHNDDFMGYSNGCNNILWDKRGEFDKWSRCEEIPKTSQIKEIIEILIAS